MRINACRAVSPDTNLECGVMRLIRRCRSARFELWHRGGGALGNESGAARATRPWHDRIVFGGCVYDTFDEALVGFHGSVPLLV